MSFLSIAVRDLVEVDPENPREGKVRVPELERLLAEIEAGFQAVLAKIGLNENLTVIEGSPGENVIAEGVLYRIVEDVPNRLIQVDRRLGANSWGREFTLARNA